MRLNRAYGFVAALSVAVVLTTLPKFSFAQISANVESSVDLMNFKPDESQPAPHIDIRKQRKTFPVSNPYIYSHFQKQFPFEINTKEKLESAANELAEKLVRENNYTNTCGDISKSEAKKDKMCDVPSRRCRISMATNRCHFVEYYARCPSGSEAPFSVGHENRGFKVCQINQGSGTTTNGGQDSVNKGGRR